MLVKTDRPQFVKDVQTGAVLNIDQEGYREHKLRREQRLAEKQQIDDRLKTLENNVAEILKLLQRNQKDN